MSQKSEIIDLATGIIFDDIEESKKDKKPNIITVNDAALETAKILVPQIGTDKALLMKGKVDVRRMSNISAVDVIWLTCFKLIEEYDPIIGDYTKKIQEEYLNHRYSVGGKNKALAVDMTNAVTGKDKSRDKTDKRTWWEKNVSRRGKPKYEDDE